MGLFQKAYETYECFSHQAGIYDNHTEPRTCRSYHYIRSD